MNRTKSLSSGWIDISVSLKSGMGRWPGDPPVQIERVLDMTRGDLANVSLLSLSAHTGTHIDAPVHFYRSKMGIDDAPFSALIGKARVIEITDPEVIHPSELRSQRIRKGERILLKTKSSPRRWQIPSFVKDFVYLSREGAQFLAGRGIKAVGIDYLSVGSAQSDGAETHRILLGAGVWIIEGLDLSKVTPGVYELICLPLKIHRGDGAPARAILRGYP
jgi:arylformamidase